MAMEDLGLTMAALVTLWVYLPGFLVNTFAMMWGKWFPRTGLGPWPIDGGRVHPDGNRWLGDGKTWNGLIGGSLTSGVLAVLMVTIIPAGRMATPFVDPMSGFDTLIGTLGRGGAAFLVGSLLGFSALIGDATGSFIKRRRGLKREGDVSSKAPLLDTLPFALAVFLFGSMVLRQGAWMTSLQGMAIILILTPILHRGFNLIGYALGWKDVPY